MKQNPRIITLLLGLIIAGVLVKSVGYTQAQVADEPPVPLPTTIEVKDDDYVVTDQTALQNQLEMDAKLNLILDNQEKIMAELGIKNPAWTEPEPPADLPIVYFNLLDYDGLVALDGIGDAKAKAILINRQSQGPVESWDDLVKRRVGVGPATKMDMEATDGGTLISFGYPPESNP